MTRSFATILAILMALPASAATRTFEATFASISDPFDGLSLLGADPSADRMVFTWSVDTAAGPVQGPSSGSALQGSGNNESAYFPYSSLEVAVGGVTVRAAPFGPPPSALYIQDGVGDGFVFDRIFVSSREDRPGPNGTEIYYVHMEAESYGFGGDVFGREDQDPAFSGLDHPTADELGDLPYRVGQLFFRDEAGRTYGVTGTDGTFRELTAAPPVAPVPLPASIAVLPLGGLALLAVGGRRRRRRSGAGR